MEQNVNRGLTLIGLSGTGPWSFSCVLLQHGGMVEKGRKEVYGRKEKKGEMGPIVVWDININK